MSLETRVYKKGDHLKIGSVLRAAIKDIYASRFLSKQLAVRDIKSKYRRSYLGIFWDLFSPLSTALVWIFLNNSGTIGLDDTGVPYPLFAFSGTLIWSMFTEALNMPLQATRSGSGIMSKINFPKEALIVSGFYKLLFNSSFKIILLIFFFIFFKVTPGWSLLLFPLGLFGLLLTGITLGLLITPLGMLYSDVARFVSMGMRFVMYVTPVVYTIPTEGLMKHLMEWNPLTPLVLVNRHLLLGLDLMYVSYFIGIMVAIIPVLCVALVFYRISIPVIVERNS